VALVLGVVVVVLVVGALLLAGSLGGLLRLDGARSPAPPAGADPVAAAATRPPPPGTRPFEVGVVGSEDPASSDQVAGLGARVARAEFTADTTVEELAPLVGSLAQRGIRLQPLVGWGNGTPAPDLTGVARWASAFGPRGSFWAGRSDAVAMIDIELGNENAFYYKSGVPEDARYRGLATAYGRRAVDAARAVDRANPAVGLLVELEAGDSESPAWIDGTLSAGGPDLVRLLHAPAIHPYGPDWRAKLDRSFRYVAKWGVHKPFALTEWGIATDDGVSLTDNYDYPTDLTYAQAARLLSTAVREMSALPGEVQQVILYQVHDQRDPGTDTEREHYFGLLRLDGSNKGELTAAARDAYGRFA